MAGWWSIEVLHGKVSAFRWQEQYDSALIEAALTNRVRDGRGTPAGGAWYSGNLDLAAASAPAAAGDGRGVTAVAGRAAAAWPR